jgi:hypothetical protein
VFVTQRGCPMNCSFCFHHAWKKKVYNANNKRVRAQAFGQPRDREIVRCAQRYNLKFVHFLDDIFNLRNDWLSEFCERYPREVGLPFDVILMANMTTEGTSSMLAQGRLRLRAHRLRGGQRPRAQRGVPQEHHAQAARPTPRVDQASTASGWAR